MVRAQARCAFESGAFESGPGREPICAGPARGVPRARRAALRASRPAHLAPARVLLLARLSSTPAALTPTALASVLRLPPFQSSGVPIDDSCKLIFDELQMAKRLRWIVFGIEATTIKVRATGDASTRGRDAWAAFVDAANMPDGECRYGVFDLDIRMSDGVHERENSKIVFVNWADDNAKIKVKMVHAASKDAFRKALDGVAVDYQVRPRPCVQTAPPRAPIHAPRRPVARCRLCRARRPRTATS